VTFADYLQLDGLNWSKLKHMRDSPAAFIWHAENDTDDTDALRLGRLTHTMLFEPERVDLDYVVWHGRRQGNDWKAFEAEHAERTILTADAYLLGLAMAVAVRRDPVAAPYLTEAEFEKPLQWLDPLTEIKCKARADILQPRRRVLADLKTCVSIDARRFGASAARLGYAGQIAHYGAGVRHALGWAPEKCVVIAVEKKPPHEVAVFTFTLEQLDTAAEEVAMLMARVQECRQSGEWPGRYTEEVALQLPAYVDGDIEIEFAEE
jgi:hypothetical protein